MRTMNDIRRNPAIMKELRWDLTPEKLAIPKEAPFDPKNAGYYFCVYLRDSKPCLALLHYLTDGTATQDCIAGFPEDLINEALRDAIIEKLLRMGYSLRNADQKSLSKQTVRQLLTDFPEVKEALRDAKWSEGQYYPINKPIENLLRMGLYGANRNAKANMQRGINCIRNPRIKCYRKTISAPPESAEHPSCLMGMKCSEKGL